ncbi:MAG: hypothetical protein ABIG66_03845 [Candidatus Kerfeldbacteria bacterium]
MFESLIEGTSIVTSLLIVWGASDPKQGHRLFWGGAAILLAGIPAGRCSLNVVNDLIEHTWTGMSWFSLTLVVIGIISCALVLLLRIWVPSDNDLGVEGGPGPCRRKQQRNG